MITNIAIITIVAFIVALYYARHARDDGSSVDLPWLLVLRRLHKQQGWEYPLAFVRTLVLWIVLVELYTGIFVLADIAVFDWFGTVLERHELLDKSFPPPLWAELIIGFVASFFSVWLCRRALALSRGPTAFLPPHTLQRLTERLNEPPLARQERKNVSPAVANEDMSRAQRKLSDQLLRQKGMVIYVINWLPLSLVECANFLRSSYGIFLSVCAHEIIGEFKPRVVLAAFRRFLNDERPTRHGPYWDQSGAYARLCETEHAIADSVADGERVHTVVMGMLRAYGYPTLRSKLQLFLKGRPERKEPVRPTPVEINNAGGLVLDVCVGGEGFAARLGQPCGGAVQVKLNGYLLPSARIVYAGCSCDPERHGFEVADARDRTIVASLIGAT